MLFEKLPYIKLCLFIFCFLVMCRIVTNGKTVIINEHRSQSDTLRGNFLIINSFDAMSIQARKNKKALFGELADSLKTMLKIEFERKQNREVIIVPGLINNPQGKDSVYIELINKYSATQAIVIRNLNAYFVQTDVEVTKEADGKKRVASYNINADISYFLYDTTGIVKESEVKVWEFFTERNVVSGLLASGPDIVGKSKHAFKIVQKNAEQYRRETEPFLQAH